MKKSLFLLATAAIALASCNHDIIIDENKDLTNPFEPQEISFAPISTPAKHIAPARAAVDGADFPTDLDMKVTAYDATAGANYFAATTFSHSSSTWKGDRYWPFAPATINFLAIANANANNETGVTWGPSSTNPTQNVQIVMSDNSTAQRDLMYACGTGTVTQTGSPANTLTFPTSVPMLFKHAQAWVKFYVQAGNSTSASAITINKITLNSVSCQGTYLVTHANWDETAASRAAAVPANSKDGSVSGVWSSYDSNVNNFDAVKDAGYSALSTSSQYYGSLMVVPNQGIASFTINYTLDGKTYNYTYTPASTALSQAYKYTYNITLTVHEIEIAPTVDPWTEGGPTAVSM